jgi:spore maturation protein CgeB
MKLVVFGLTISSAWGNGHATLWRGLCKALGNMGHRVVFFERDLPYYAAHRDSVPGTLEGCDLRLYGSWGDIREEASRELSQADVGMVTSYAPHGVEAGRLMMQSNARLRVFYDMDTPVTLLRLGQGERVPYIGPERLGGYDLVLSFTGGKALEQLRTILGARRVAPLYGSVDPEVHRPAPASSRYQAWLSYLGTYAADRQQALEALLLEPARRRADKSFLIGGSQYPADLSWPPNVRRVDHVPPADHPRFHGSARLSLNITRGAMASMGYCPSGRLFEVAACGVPILTDDWEGLEEFFEPGRELLVARSAEQALEAMQLPDDYLREVAARARDRVLAQHTAAHRAQSLLELLADSVAAQVGGNAA